MTAGAGIGKAEHHERLAVKLDVIADAVKRKNPAMARFLKQCADALGSTPSTGGCVGCGGPLPQAATGRPRRWCSERCRSRARRR